jgi:hypothetical protein
MQNAGSALMANYYFSFEGLTKHDIHTTNHFLSEYVCPHAKESSIVGIPVVFRP